MATSSAHTVAAYLAEQPADRRATLRKVRSVVRKHLPRGYQEAMNFGMITWRVPLRVYADTGNGKPLCYAALAALKRNLAPYLMPVYANRALAGKLRAGFKQPRYGQVLHPVSVRRRSSPSADRRDRRRGTSREVGGRRGVGPQEPKAMTKPVPPRLGGSLVRHGVVRMDR